MAAEAAEVVAGEVAGEGTDAPRGSLPTNGTLWASAQRRWTERRSRASRGPAGRSLGSFRWRALDACLAYRVLSFRPALGLRAAVLPPDSARAMAVQVPAFFDLDTLTLRTSSAAPQPWHVEKIAGQAQIET